ncbi:hypothetical protein O4J55_27300, partial [Paracoccus sp. PXZ]
AQGGKRSDGVAAWRPQQRVEAADQTGRSKVPDSKTQLAQCQASAISVTLSGEDRTTKPWVQTPKADQAAPHAILNEGTGK